MAFARLYILKFSRGNMPPDPAYDPNSYAFRRADKGPPLPTPLTKKFLDPYAYDLAWYDQIWHGKFTKHPLPQQKDGSFAPE